PHPQAQPPSTHSPTTYSRTQIDFPMRFFDVDRSSLWIAPQGFIAFTSDGNWYYTNTNFPNTANPNGIIAPWWDDLDLQGSGAHLKTQILGVAPNRILVAEWRAGMYYASTAFANFQVWL